MKKNFLLFTILMLAGLKGFSQAKLETDTLVWLFKPREIPFPANGLLFFSNAGNKSFTGKLYVMYKTNFNTKPAKSDSINFVQNPHSFTSDQHPLKPNDSTYVVFGIPLDTVYFVPNQANIVVVWPTGNGITTVDTARYTFTPSLYTSIQPSSKGSSTRLRFYPNPAIDIVHLDVLEPGLAIKELEITDMSGKEVNNWTQSDNAMNVANLSPGFYIVRLRFSNNTIEEFRLVRSLIAK